MAALQVQRQIPCEPAFVYPDHRQETGVTAANPIPDGYDILTPYIVVDDPDRLVDFLKAAFGAVENQRVPRQDGGRTGHAPT